MSDLAKVKLKYLVTGVLKAFKPIDFVSLQCKVFE